LSLLDVDRVSKRFGGVHAVQEVSFTVDAGDLVGVMGPNGSGKTTLFNVVSGALRPDGGAVRLEGRVISGLAPHRVCAAGVARTFQHVRAFVGLTVLENVLVGRFYGRATGPDATADAERLLTLVGLEGQGHVVASRLTLMDRKRLELARALATAPRVLLLDEFMAGLNPTETETAMRLVRRLQAEGLTLLMVEHIVWALMELSRRIVVLSAGEKIAEGAPAAIASDPAVVDVYLGTQGQVARA
jgi:branched-chain amino acid transport system ATP-binding protein